MIRHLQFLARRFLPEAIRKPLADRVYGLLTKAINLKARTNRFGRGLWLRLLTLHPHLERVLTPYQVKAAKLAQRLGINYSRHIERFGQALPQDRPSENFSGVSLMIGTLGGGGSERQLVLTAKGLRERGVSDLAVAVVYMEDQADCFYLPDLTEAQVRVDAFERIVSKRPLPEEALRASRRLPRKLSRLRPYMRALNHHRPQVVHLWLDDMNVKGGLAAVALGVPRIVLGMRSLPPTNFLSYQPYMRDCYRWLARQPGVVMLNNSQAGARAYEKWLALPPESIQVLRNGFVFDHARLDACRAQRDAVRHSLGIEPGAPVVGGVMRMAEEKRPYLWLIAAARLSARLPEARFILAGDGPFLAAMRRKAAKLGLEGRLRLLGQTRQPLETMAAMDLFLLTSRMEGLPNVLVEAQSLGVPVVTTKVGGAPEALNHEETGWVLDRDEPGYIAAELLRLWQDGPWRERVQAKAPAFVEERFGLERMLDETWALYQLDQDNLRYSGDLPSRGAIRQPAFGCAAPSPMDRIGNER